MEFGSFLFLEFKFRTLYLISTDFFFTVFFSNVLSTFHIFQSSFLFSFRSRFHGTFYTIEIVKSAFTHVISCPHHVHDLSGGLGLLVLNIVFDSMCILLIALAIFSCHIFLHTHHVTFSSFFIIESRLHPLQPTDP